MKLDFTEQMSWCSPRWQVMVPYNYTVFLDNAKELVAEKKVSMSRIDDAVARILRVKFEMGLFEKPYADKSLQSYLGAPVSTNLCCCKCPKHFYGGSDGVWDPCKSLYNNIFDLWTGRSDIFW